jgi:hypothetical protein
VCGSEIDIDLVAMSNNKHHKTPPATATIGRVMTGNYSLKRGRGFGIGAVRLDSFIDMVTRDTR